MATLCSRFACYWPTLYKSSGCHPLATDEHAGVTADLDTLPRDLRNTTAGMCTAVVKPCAFCCMHSDASCTNATRAAMSCSRCLRRAIFADFCAMGMHFAAAIVSEMRGDGV
eukprot:6172057-Pleurochrysis_carterae.AAC.1